MKRLLIPLLLLLFLPVFSQTGEVNSGMIKGTITDENTGEHAPFCVVVLKDAHKRKILAAESDFDGKYQLRPVAPGVYTLIFELVGYQTDSFPNVIVTAGRITYADKQMRLPPCDCEPEVNTPRGNFIHRWKMKREGRKAAQEAMLPETRNATLQGITAGNPPLPRATHLPPGGGLFRNRYKGSFHRRS